ncbi:MAG: hypothetical protein RL681_386 [Candidatus Parcubacteria bacterium]|jgi:hypothetical protein
MRTSTIPLAGFVVALICLVSFITMAQVSSQESPIMDELAHIPAGYGYVRYLDFRLNPEHPPLVKALAGIPLLFAGVKFPTDHSSWQTDVNGQWEAGNQFFYFSGNDADRLVQTARYGPIVLTLLLIVLIYAWSAELMGRWWALLPTLLFGLSPHVLAHGHYVTTDIAAAFGVVLATYYFIRMLHSPTKRSVLFAGLAFGIAQSGKFSAVLLVPYFLVLAAIYGGAQGFRAAQGMERFSRWKTIAAAKMRHIARTIVVITLGYLIVVYPLYALFTVNYPIEKQTSDTSTILASFAGGPTPDGAVCKPARCLADLNVWMAGNPVARPFGEYMLGVLMVLQRSAGGNTNYFLGEVSASGWHYYFPVVYAAKEPLPTLILVLAALLGGLVALWRAVKTSGWRFFRRLIDWLGVNFAEFAMLLFIAFYWAWSIKSPLNIGFRHLFPTLPFIYILAAEFWRQFTTSVSIPRAATLVGALLHGTRAVLFSSLKYLATVVLVVWFLLSVLAGYPYYLSYFNEFAGGTMGGYRLVTDSNYDWGQDLARLREFVAAHPEIDRIGVDYFGGGNPKYYLGNKEENWWSARGNPVNENIHWLAVSVNSLQGAMQKGVPGFERKSEDEYRWLTELRPQKPGMGNVPEPDYRVGTSIFVYKL